MNPEGEEEDEGAILAEEWLKKIVIPYLLQLYKKLYNDEMKITFLTFY